MGIAIVKKSRKEFYVKLVVALVLYFIAVGLVICDAYFGLGIKIEYMTLILGSCLSVGSAILTDALTAGKETVRLEQSAGFKLKKYVFEGGEE